MLDYTFTRIYDSGSSLGREIAEDNIPSFLESKERVVKYIQKGISEIRWNEQKVNHFELLQKVQFQYKEQLKHQISQIIVKYDQHLLMDLIDNIDKDLPEQYQQNKLSLQRKKLIFSLIDFRVQYLKQLFKL